MASVLTESTATRDRGSGSAGSVFDLPDVAPTHLEASDAGMRMTPAEYDAVETWDELYRFELRNGVVIVSPATSIGERNPGDWFAAELRAYRRTEAGKSLDLVTLPEHDIELPNGRRRADRVVWCGLGRRPDPAVDVPTIAIEFVSKDRRDHHRDYVEKRREYLEVGVREYWVIDRFRRTLTVCVTPAGAAGRTVVKEKGSYRTDLLPGFELRVADVLAEADEFDPPGS